MVLKSKEIIKETQRNFFLVPINSPELEDILAQIVSEDFGISTESAKFLISKRVLQHLARLKDDTKLVIERNYVDKVYRDSYYTYYASKRTHYGKDAIKISFFSDENEQITLDWFRNNSKVSFLEECYRGFIVLRPTPPYIVGRSAIAPNLLKINSFKTCLVNIPSTAMGLKVSVQAFPFSSQDTETISCAETMIWALMEYYGNKYPEYSPVLPSKILNILKQNIVERQLPSSGLSVESMSYLLKECGFGPKLYSREEFGSDFEELLSCYIESGIPIIIALDNAQAVEEKTVNRLVGHAVLCIGHEKITEEKIKAITPQEFQLNESSHILRIKDWDKIDKKFIFVDDNFPVYQLESLDTPANRYLEIPVEDYPDSDSKAQADEEWKSCKISHFIVPLYKKIYLEAYVAKTFVKKLLCSKFFNFADKKEIYIRTFLCSARSYREYVMLNDMNDKLKNIIINKSFPKFVWVTEIFSNSSIQEGKANGLILLDATEANTLEYRPLIFAMCNGSLLQYNKDNKTITSYQMTGSSYTIFDKNLKNL